MMMLNYSSRQTGIEASVSPALGLDLLYILQLHTVAIAAAVLDFDFHGEGDFRDMGDLATPPL